MHLDEPYAPSPEDLPPAALPRAATPVAAADRDRASGSDPRAADGHDSADGSRAELPVDDRKLPGPSSRSAQELEPIWHAILDVLASQVQREQFDTWFPRTALRGIDERRVTVAVPNGFTADWLQSYYRRVIDGAIAQVLGSDHVATFIVDPELTGGRGVERRRTRHDADDAAAADASREASRGTSFATAAAGRAGERTGERTSSNDRSSDAMGERGAARDTDSSGPGGGRHAPRLGLMSASDFGLNANYRFENFVVGPCNRFAHAAAFGVSESPGKTYNPFFLHGNVGLGKTHLMQSLCHSLLDRDPNVRILYLSCETFVNHFINALENGDLQKFRNKYRNVDVLVVDDIHLLANKERTQEEFFHTFNAVYNAGKQIVLSSDSPPKDIPSLQGRLVSRFKWGLVTEIEPPCYETRMAILKRKSRDRGTELPDDVARMLAERIDSNIRELEGAVTKVLGFAGLAKLPVTVELARECLRDVFAQRVGAPTMEDVLRVVTEHFGVRLSDLQSRKRTAQIAHARQVGMYLARQVTRLSLEEIGGFYGGRDHSTVLYAIQKVSGVAKSDAGTQDVLSDLLVRLRGRS